MQIVLIIALVIVFFIAAIACYLGKRMLKKKNKKAKFFGSKL